MTIENRFHELPTLLSKAFRAEDYIRVKALVHEYRSLTADHKNNWNYGNALHQVPTWLGLVALAENDVATAKDKLAEAAQTSGRKYMRTAALLSHSVPSRSSIWSISFCTIHKGRASTAS